MIETNLNILRSKNTEMAAVVAAQRITTERLRTDAEILRQRAQKALERAQKGNSDEPA